MRVESFHWEDDDKSLNDWCQRLLGNEVFSFSADRLERNFSSFKEYFKALNIPIATIAGTNGKGQVCLYLEEYLLQNNYFPLLWSSPHCLTVRERFSYGGELISCGHLLRCFQRNEKLVSSLSFYEFLFYCFCELSLEACKRARERGERPVLLLEVGLGGRLDAVNFFDADWCALTSIGRDHIEFLGSDLEGILREKLGITRRGRPLICAVTQRDLEERVAEHCKENDIPLLKVELEEGEAFPKRNELVAKELAKLITGLPKQNYCHPKYLWARPFEVTYEGWEFTLLGSHNLDGLLSLVQWVEQKHSNVRQHFDELWLGLSRSDEQDIFNCLELVKNSPSLGERVRFFEFDHPRATTLVQLRAAWKRGGRHDPARKVSFETEFEYLLDETNKASKANRARRVLICGSYYFIGHILGHPKLRQRLYSKA